MIYNLKRYWAKTKLSSIVHLIAACLLVITLPLTSQAELLFEDDFSSGDISKHNDYFRWGREGTILAAGTLSNKIVAVNGPSGNTVDAIQFTYGTWQEVRFHLTESVNQVIEYDNANTDVQYQSVWISYDMLVPENYHHRSTNSTVNNKGFLSLWQDGYSTQAKCQGQIEWWPTAEGNSEMTMNVGGHKRNYSFVDPAYISTTYYPEAAAAFDLSKDRGKWRNFGFYFYAGSQSGARDGIYEFYVDGKLKARMTGINYQRNVSSDPLGFNKGYLLGYHNSGYDEQTTFHITNFKFGDSKEGVIPPPTDAKSPASPPSGISSTIVN